MFSALPKRKTAWTTSTCLCKWKMGIYLEMVTANFSRVILIKEVVWASNTKGFDR